MKDKAKQIRRLATTDPQGFVDKAFVLTGHNQLSPMYHDLNFKVFLAHRLLAEIISKPDTPEEKPVAKPEGFPLAPTAKNLALMIAAPAAYGISQADLPKLIDATYHLTGDARLSPFSKGGLSIEDSKQIALDLLNGVKPGDTTPPTMENLAAEIDAAEESRKASESKPVSNLVISAKVLEEVGRINKDARGLVGGGFLPVEAIRSGINFAKSGLGAVGKIVALMKTIFIAATTGGMGVLIKKGFSAIGKALSGFLGKKAGKQAGRALTLIGGGTMLGGPVGLVIGIIAFMAGTAIGKAFLIGMVALFLAPFFAWLGTVLLFVMGIIGSILLLTIFILFIINSGAYIVPGAAPSTSVGTSCLKPEEAVNGTVGCFELVGGWTQQQFDIESQAIKIISKTGPFYNKLCSGKKRIKITYSCENTGWGGFAKGLYDITIYQKGTGSLGNTLYTLAHETGHLYDMRTKVRERIYDGNNLIPATEKDNCTYPFAAARNTESERFAELISLYIAGPNPISGYRDLSCMNDILRIERPVSWQFARDYIFESDLGW